MINSTNQALVRFWLTPAGHQALRLLNNYALHLGDELFGYLGEINGVLQYLEIPAVEQFLQERGSAQPLDILDIGCGNGWEAFALAFLLHPARVIGISNEQEEPQNWDEKSITVGALNHALPDLVERIQRIASQIEEDWLYYKLGELFKAMAAIPQGHLVLMRLDIENPAWPHDYPLFDFVFSRWSFYHTKDRLKALENIKHKMSPQSLYFLHEPNEKLDGSPDLTTEWFDRIAVGQVRFQRHEIVEMETSSVPAVLIWRSG